MFPDFLDLLRVLEKHKVQYLIIGGYAVGLHGEPRATKDLDILVNPTRKNAKALLAALTEFGAPVSDLTVKDLSTPGLLYVFGINPLRVDILNRIKGVKIESLLKRAELLDLSGIEVPLVSLPDLIKLKKIAGRAQDRADVAKLKRVLALRKQERK
jgi:predicted nucleotidyltransferase